MLTASDRIQTCFRHGTVLLGRWFFGLLLRSILSLSGTIFLSCRHKFRMAGQDREDGLFQCRLVPRGLILNLGMTFALRIMGQRLGDELRFLPPHAVKDLNGRLLLRVSGSFILKRRVNLPGCILSATGITCLPKQLDTAVRIPWRWPGRPPQTERIQFSLTLESGAAKGWSRRPQIRPYRSLVLAPSPAGC